MGFIMRVVKFILLSVAALCVLSSCKNAGRNSGSGASETKSTGNSILSEKIAPVYAKGFMVTYTENGCLLDIQDPQREESRVFRYMLVDKGTKVDKVPDGYTKLEIPVESVICMTSLQLSSFIKLDELDKVVGVTSTRHLFNEEMNQRLADGLTHKIGIEGNFDNEVIMGINPDLILISPFKRGGYDALKDVDIPLVPHLGYKEMTPLGQAEWIKFVGLLIGETEKANTVFAEIESRYNELKKLTQAVTERPVVFSGELRGGNWYAVGGKSFLAQLFRDAGADYFLSESEDEHSGGVTLDFETVYSKASKAKYWRIVNSYKGTFSYEALRDEDARYADFDAFKNKGVVYCNMREVPFYESMPTQPEVVLSDLIKIFHPSLLPDNYVPSFYKLLK